LSEYDGCHQKRRKKINLEKLSYGLGVPVLPISVLKKQGIEKLIEKIQESAKKRPSIPVPCTYDPRVEAALHEIEDVLGETKRQETLVCNEIF
jgi:ferrous iron transport protein B